MIKKIPKDHPHRRTIASLENDMTEAVYAVLQQMAQSLTDGITADNVHEMTRRLSQAEYWQPLRDVIVEQLMMSADAGVTTARVEVEREVFGAN